MSQEIQQTFIDLCRQISEAYQASNEGSHSEPVDAEPYLIALLHYVQSHPEQRDLFVKLFLRVADGEIPTPWFLLGFCMHELRYPEVREHILREYQDGYHRPTFGRRYNYLRLNLAIFDNQDSHFVRMWSRYNNE